MTRAGDTRDGLDGLTEDARARLDVFGKALDRVHIDDLSMYVARERQPRHRRAVETAELVAIESGLVGAVTAARSAVVESVIRSFNDRQLRVSIVGMNTAPNLGPVDERVRIARSLSEAITAIVLGDRLEPDVRGELLGLWDRLLP